MPGEIEDYNDPLPTNWVPANAVIAGTQKRVILTNVRDAKAVYNNAPGPESWDALFREAVVRLLASELSIAIAGRPETSQLALDSYGAFAALGQSREG